MFTGLQLLAVIVILAIGIHYLLGEKMKFVYCTLAYIVSGTKNGHCKMCGATEHKEVN